MFRRLANRVRGLFGRGGNRGNQASGRAAGGSA